MFHFCPHEMILLINLWILGMMFRPWLKFRRRRTDTRREEKIENETRRC